MNNNIGRICSWLSFLFVFLLSSCDHIELEYRQDVKRVRVEVEFDWTSDPEASPSEMVVYFYRIGDRSNKSTSNTRAGTRYTFEFNGREGGLITLPPGQYAAISHNNDSGSHGFVGLDSYEEFGLSLRDFERATVSGNSDSERKAHIPDDIWCGTIPSILITVPENGSQEQEPLKAVFTMQSVVWNVTFVIHHPINYTSDTKVNADITGMSGKIHPASWLTGDETVTHTFPMTPDDKGNLVGHLRTFGHCTGRPAATRQDDNESDAKEALHFLHLTNGKGWKSSHNVTKQIHEYAETYHPTSRDEIIIEMDSVFLPEPTGSAGPGFIPTVGGWQGSQETVGM